jgi:hypothetical protein
MKRSIKMKKAIICAFALSLFALPMSLHANPPAKADEAKTAKPLSAMKSTVASPSKAGEEAAKGSETDQEPKRKSNRSLE